MTNDAICNAIQNKRVVTFFYKSRERTVEPHLLGYDHDGDLTLSAFQISGGSARDFRDFHVAKLTGLTITAQNFAGPRPGYNPNDKTIARVICRL